MPVMEMEKENSALTAENVLKMADKIRQNEQEDKNFAARLAEFLKSEKGRTGALTVAATSNVLAVCGAKKDLDVVIRPDTIYKCMSSSEERYHGHDLSRSIMEQLPEQLRNPAMIFKGNKDNSLVVITELKDKENREVMVAVSLSETNGRREVNRISSAYGRNNMSNYLNAQIAQGNLIAANKEKADRMLQSLGLQSPPEETFISFDNSIAYSMANVKYPQDNLTENTQFYNREMHDKLLPFLNAKAQYHENRLDVLKEKRGTRTAKIEKNRAKIERLSAKAEKLEDINRLVSAIAKNNPIVRTFVDKNADKIKEIRDKKIPARESKIAEHEKRVAEIDKKSQMIGHKLHRCIALNDTVKSFVLIGAERRNAFSAAMSELNKATIDCIGDRKAALTEQMQQLSSQKRDLNTVRAFQTKLDKMEGQLAKLKIAEEKYSLAAENDTEKLIGNTEKIIAQSIEQGNISVPELSENICRSNADAIAVDAELENNSRAEAEIEFDPDEDLRSDGMAAEEDYNSVDGNISSVERDETNDVPPDPTVREEKTADKAEENVQLENNNRTEAEIEINSDKDLRSDEMAAEEDYNSVDGNISSVDRDETNDVPPDPTVREEKTADKAEENVQQQSSRQERGYRKINPDVYRQIPKEDRLITTETPKVGAVIMSELKKHNIPFSAVETKEGITITVSKANENAFKTAENKAKDTHVKLVNPEVYKSLPKQERFTQRMDEEQAQQAVKELAAAGIMHSAVMNNEKSAVTISQNDYKEARAKTTALFSRKNLNDISKRIKENRQQQREIKDKNKGKDKNKDVGLE